MLSENPKFPKKTLKKSERLKSRSTIQSLFTLHKQVKLYPFKLVYMVENSNSFQIEFGVSVSKRNFKTAVARNRIKRHMREAYRLNKHIMYDKLESMNISVPMMLVYIGKDPTVFADVQTKLCQILVRLSDKVIKENNSLNTSTTE